jgi:hypothetical protein
MDRRSLRSVTDGCELPPGSRDRQAAEFPVLAGYRAAVPLSARGIREADGYEAFLSARRLERIHQTQNPARASERTARIAVS